MKTPNVFVLITTTRIVISKPVNPTAPSEVRFRDLNRAAISGANPLNT
jgi:hypothetical protein